MRFLTISKSNLNIVLKLISFTLLSVLVRGYQYGSGNQVHYFNYAFYKFYSGIYPNDYLFKMHDVPYTIFVDFIVFVLNLFGENRIVFFLIYFVFLFLFYSAIYLISNRLFKNSKVAAIMLLFFIVPIPIGGTIINTFEKSLMPRFIAEVFLLFSIYFLIIGKNILSSVLAGVGFLFHPLTVIPYIPVVVLSKIFEIKKSSHLRRANLFKISLWKPVFVQSFVFIFVASPILSKFIFYNQNSGLFIDPEWGLVISERLSYLYIARWSIINFLAIFIICVYFSLYKFIFGKTVNVAVKAILFVSVGLFTVSLLSAIFNFRLGLQLQLGRNLYLLVVFAIIYGIGSVLEKISIKRLYKIAAITVFISLIFCFSGRKQYGFLWNNPLTEYQKAALWAKNNTSNESAFLVPINEFGFRFWSKRSVFLEHKEGGDSLYDRNFAMEWDKRKDLINANPEFSKEYVETLKRDYKIDYIVTTLNLPEILVYKNDKFFVYEI